MRKNPKNGFVWNTLGSTMYGANSFIMLALVSRVGTVEQSGYFSIAFTTAQLLYIVGLFGVSHYQMTDYGEKYQFSDYLLVRCFSCCLMMAGCAAAIVFLGFTGEKAIYTFSLTLLMLLNAVGDLYQSLFFQKNRLDLSGSALFYRTLWPLLLFSAVLLSARRIILAVAAQTALNFAVTCYYAKKAGPFLPAEKSRLCLNRARKLTAECVSLFFGLLIMNLIINISRYGVEFLLDDRAQGYYGMIFMPAQVINLCSQFLFKPFLNQYAVLLSEEKHKDFAVLLKRQFLFISSLTLACCGGAYYLGTPVLGFLYRKDLDGLALPLVVIVFGGGLFAACQLMYYIFVILRRQKYIFLIYIAVCPLILGITIFLINMWGLLGAAISFAAAHMLILACYVWLLKRILRRNASA